MRVSEARLIIAQYEELVRRVTGETYDLTTSRYACPLELEGHSLFAFETTREHPSTQPLKLGLAP